MICRPTPTAVCSSVLAAAALALCWLAAASSQAAGPSALGGEFRVNTLTDRIQQSSSVALDADGDFVVVWQGEVAGSGDEIRAQRFDARGVAQGGEFAVNTVSKGDQNLPSVALDADGDFVVAWQSLVAGNLVIRARRFDARGVAQGEEFAVHATSGDDHSAPAVAIDADGDFVVVWESSLNGSYEIRARRFAAGGVALDREITVNTLTASSQRAPSVAIDADGDFVVAWRSNIAGSFEIRAQRFTAGGVAQGDELAVNARKAGDQLAPSVAIDADGDFVVAWENAWEGDFAIRARRFTAGGVAQGGDFEIDPEGAGEQFSPAVAMDADGDFVVAWQSKIAGSYEIRARGFDPRGVAQGDAIAVNTLTAGTQKAVACAMDAGGDFVLAWHGDGTGNWEIGARRYQRTPRRPALAPVSGARSGHRHSS